MLYLHLTGQNRSSETTVSKYGTLANPQLRFPSHIFLNIRQINSFHSKIALTFPQTSFWFVTYPYENQRVPSFDNSKKFNIGATFLSRLFVNHHGWMASNQHRYIIGSQKQWLHWRNMIISSPTKFRRWINGEFTDFDLPKYLYYRTTYSIQWPFSVVGLFLLPLKDGARIIAR